MISVIQIITAADKKLYLGNNHHLLVKNYLLKKKDYTIESQSHRLNSIMKFYMVKNTFINHIKVYRTY